MRKTHNEMTKVIEEYMIKTLGYAPMEMEWCLSQNATYMECPTRKHSTKTNFIALYNPSLET